LVSLLLVIINLNLTMLGGINMPIILTVLGAIVSAGVSYGVRTGLQKASEKQNGQWYYNSPWG
ncbi:hypothetical protein, partial [Bacillus cereus]|uniref:hypothetical protein n=1 Tax=Bacillus cereus TaxID=1396 RepID=UPI001EE07F53